MAAYISFQPTDFFNTKIWTGNGVSGRAMTGVGFQPNFLWIKGRSDGTDHELMDSARGVSKYINTNVANAEATNTEGLISFDADGYTLGNANYWNWNTKTFVGWSWKGGTSAVPSGGTITPSACNFNTTTGFGAYKYTGTGSAATIAHGLTLAPEIMLVKSLDATHTWGTYSKAMGNGYQMVLNNNSSRVGPLIQYWNNTDPTTTVFSIGTDSYQNQSGTDYICYCFSSVRGYSKMGAYTGNGNANGPFVYTGFRPAFVMSKAYSTTGQWMMVDDKRPLYYNGSGAVVYADASVVETQNTTWTTVDFLSNGFKPRYTDGLNNGAGTSYIYMAFAEFPFVSSNSKAGVAR